MENSRSKGQTLGLKTVSTFKSFFMIMFSKLNKLTLNSHVKVSYCGVYRYSLKHVVWNFVDTCNKIN